MNWLEKSAEYRNINSMIYLGIMHRDELGVESDIRTAYFWFTVAGLQKMPKSGDKEPIEFTKALGLLISKDDIENIIESAKVWIQEHPYLEPQVFPLQSIHNPH